MKVLSNKDKYRGGWTSFQYDRNKGQIRFEKKWVLKIEWTKSY